MKLFEFIKRKTKKITLFFTGTIVLLIVFYFVLGSFLKFEKPIQSPNIILEGWASKDFFENYSNFNYDSIFIFDLVREKKNISLKDIDKSFKLKKNKDRYSLAWDGTLIFKIPKKKLNKTFTLSFKMRGSANNKLYAHYNVYADKEYIDSGFANKNDSIYKYKIKNNGTLGFKYILINFDNDKFTNNEDRNLYVSEVKVNSITIDLIATDIFFLKSDSPSGRTLVSELYSIENYLSDFGLDTLKIKVIKSNLNSYNNTLKLANTAKEYFLKTNIKNANIITPDFHSRRSYLNFKNCLKNTLEIGCIPMKTEQKKKTLSNKIDDRVSLLFTFIYWGFH